jgi:hypothetical protein
MLVPFYPITWLHIEEDSISLYTSIHPSDHVPSSLPTLLGQFLALQHFNLNMGAAGSSQISVSAYITTKCHNLADHNLNYRIYANLMRTSIFKTLKPKIVFAGECNAHRQKVHSLQQ